MAEALGPVTAAFPNVNDLVERDEDIGAVGERRRRLPRPTRPDRHELAVIDAMVAPQGDTDLTTFQRPEHVNLIRSHTRTTTEPARSHRATTQPIRRRPRPMRGFGHILDVEVASMYIEKRWLVPTALTLVLFGALFAMALLLVDVDPAEIASNEHQSKAPELVSRQAPICDPPPTVTHVAETAPPVAPTAPIVPAARTVPSGAAPVPAVGSPGTPQPEEVVDIETVDSSATQITTRGFGDVGMQFQRDVQINAPITVVHVSNEGNNDATNANIGEENRAVSEQEQLQSNRSDGSVPVPTASATSTTPRPLTCSPAAAPATGTASMRAHHRHP